MSVLSTFENGCHSNGLGYWWEQFNKKGRINNGLTNNQI